MNSDAAAQLYGLFGGPVFLSAFFSWFVAQLIKTLIEALKNRSILNRDFLVTLFWRTGGMPSSHSSLVSALAVSIGFSYGIETPLFVLSLFYGILIIRDALGVRRAAGNQARAINKLGRELEERMDVRFEPVKEINGHTPAEVTVGILLGVFIALAFSLL